MVVFSKPDAVKARNLRANPRLMVALGDPGDDFEVGLIEAEATLPGGAAEVPDAFFAKYADELGAGRLDPAAFRALYTQAIRITPTRFLAWRGRGERRDAAPVDGTAAAAVRSRRGVVVRLAAELDRLSSRLRGATSPVGAPATA
jgi:hypothetical protein